MLRKLVRCAQLNETLEKLRYRGKGIGFGTKKKKCTAVPALPGYHTDQIHVKALYKANNINTQNLQTVGKF